MSITREKENVQGTCQRRLGERECSPRCDSAERCDRRRMRNRGDDLHRTAALREGRAVLARLLNRPELRVKKVAGYRAMRGLARWRW